MPDLILVTNQSGIARGLLATILMLSIGSSRICLVKQAQCSRWHLLLSIIRLRGGCRKPNRGMIDQAVLELGVDLDRSYVIGDHLRDVELAKRVGSRKCFVTTGVTRLQDVKV